jgi:hypothetical protein
MLRPHLANEIGRCRGSEPIVSTGVSRQERMGNLEVRTLRTPAYATNNDTHHASDAACYGRRVNHVYVNVASRRRTRIVLGCGGLDDGSSVPSPCTLSTGSSERMREGCVRDLGAKHIVTDEAQGRRAATGSSATSMFIIRRRTGRPTCLNHGACRPMPSARRRRTPAAHRQRQPEPGAGIDDFPGKEVRVLGAKEQSRMRGEDVMLPLEVQPRWRSAKDNAPAASYSLDSLSRRDGACHPTLAARRRRSPVARRHLEPSPAPERRLVHAVRRQARG